jgi:hypothetical protein
MPCEYKQHDMKVAACEVRSFHSHENVVCCLLSCAEYCAGLVCPRRKQAGEGQPIPNPLPLSFNKAILISLIL